MEPTSSRPPRLEYATAATPVSELPLLAKCGHAFAIIWGALMVAVGLGIAIVAWRGVSSDLSETDGLLALAAAAVGGGIVMLKWLAFERSSRGASLAVAALATIGTVSLIGWLLPMACSWRTWQEVISFSAFAALPPFMTGVAAYAHWRWARLLQKSATGRLQQEREERGT